MSQTNYWIPVDASTGERVPNVEPQAGGRKAPKTFRLGTTRVVFRRFRSTRKPRTR